MRHRALLGVLILALPACGGEGAGGNSLPGAEGTSSVFSDPGIESFPDEGHSQVPVGTGISYTTDPPTSGPSYPVPQPGGFYTDPVDPGYLVQSMAQGGVIIYYDALPISAPDLDSLRLLAEAHPGDVNQVVVVPRTDPTSPVIVTAWTHLLRLTSVDLARIENFISLYLGKGPQGL